MYQSLAGTKEKFALDYELIEDFDKALETLWDSNPDVYAILKTSKTLEEARDRFYSYLDQAEREIFRVHKDDIDDSMTNVPYKSIMRECIRFFRSVIAPINEHRNSFSALEALWSLANGKIDEFETKSGEKVEIGFLVEFIYQFRGLTGNATIYLSEASETKHADFMKLKGREAALVRMEILDHLTDKMHQRFEKYPSGLEADVIKRREENKKRILEYFGGKDEDWTDANWHLKHVIKTPKAVLDLIKLPPEQVEAVKKISANRIPFGITPYYLSLMDPEGSDFDHCVRNMVVPPADYVDTMVENKDNRGAACDFMGENDCSPVDLITRRYPMITIMKPYNTCSQICVYCQRNWEIDEVLDPRAMSSAKKIDEAIKWISEHKSIGEVLVTGGDPVVMNDKNLKKVLDKIAAIDHVYRIRIGSRTPVVLPMRWTDELIELLKSYVVPGKREVAVSTHFEHSYEITPEAMEAVQKIRMAGMSAYNQQVFTFDNSRKYESCKLRRDLKSIGIDPYYNFNMKGKKETRQYMVPIARILQERKEEARLLPGQDRTDEPVFNVPRLGKNHLRAWQDHRLGMVMPDGSRAYVMHPWERFIAKVAPYNYRDVPIYEYLKKLKKRGEDMFDYHTIWYYY